MIKFLDKNDVSLAATFIYKKNQDKTFRSGFCSSTEANIKKDIQTALENDQCLGFYDHGELLGVLLTVTSPNGDVDVIGPYVQNNSIEIGYELLQEALAKLQKNNTIHFFFSKESTFNTFLMDKINAQFEEIEYIMKCYEYQDQFLEEKGSLVKATKEEKFAVKELYQEIFSKTYLPSEKIITDAIYQYVYLYKLNQEVVGVALLKQKEKSSYLEFFGLKKDHRQKGLSKYFLDTIIRQAIINDGSEYIMLVVDEENNVASKLYQKLGFIVEEVNVSYTLTY